MSGPLPVVIVHRRQPKRCVRTGEALLAQGLPVRLIVVDNGSPAEDIEAVREGLPTAEIVELGANTGFGPGANAGLRRFLSSDDGDWVALCPHDALPADGALRALLDAARSRPRAGLLCAEFGYDLIPVVDPYFGGIELPAERGEGWHDVGYPHGTLMLLGRRCLEDVGLFDERYFAYVEEADLAVRARRRGWEIGMVWGAVVRNSDVGSTLPTVEYLQLRNSLLLVRTWFGRYRTFIRLCWAGVNTARLLAMPSQRTPYFDVRARMLAVRDFLAGRFGPPPEELGRSASV